MRKTAIAALVCVAISSSACVGKFALFNRVQDWNKGVSDKWINSVLHMALWIVPVYEICLLGDLLVFNTIEFWSGANPVASAEVDHDEVGLTVVVDGRRYELRARDETSVSVWRDGVYLGAATRTPEGGWMLVDELHERTVDVSRVEADDLLAMLPQ